MRNNTKNGLRMLRVKDISYSVPGNSSETQVKLLKHISIDLDQGQSLAVMGESGCGKTTLLKFIYGLLPYDGQEVLWNGEPLKGAEDTLIAGHEMMKYVPQEFELMPFTTVFENVGEHLSIQNDHREARINELLDVVDLSAYSSRKVKNLSGGQKQRVAIAKALAQEPRLLLLDEPFSHIDNFRKNDLRRRLFKYLETNQISCIIATHDKDDVLSFTDETLILRNGKTEDYRLTKEVYNNPKNVYCASLFDEVTELDGSLFGKEGKLILYPHQLIVVEEGGIQVKVKKSYWNGRDYLIAADYYGNNVFFRSIQELESGRIIRINLNP